MIFLSGHIRPELSHPQLGWMLTPDMFNRLPARGYWAFDNACFAHSDTYDFDKWSRALQRHLETGRDRLLFAVAPDVFQDAAGTVERFYQHRSRLRSLGVPLAFVTQGGMSVEDVPWRDIDALFCGGGAPRFSQETAALIAAAKERGMWTHMGMCNSLYKLQMARSLGCDSADGTFLKYGPDTNWRRLRGWFDQMAAHPVMRLAV